MFCLAFKKIDVTNKAVAEILSKATEYLQPNPGNVSSLEILCSFLPSQTLITAVYLAFG